MLTKSVVLAPLLVDVAEHLTFMWDVKVGILHPLKASWEKLCVAQQTVTRYLNRNERIVVFMSS